MPEGYVIEWPTFGELGIFLEGLQDLSVVWCSNITLLPHSGCLIQVVGLGLNPVLTY